LAIALHPLRAPSVCVSPVAGWRFRRIIDAGMRALLFLRTALALSVLAPAGLAQPKPLPSYTDVQATEHAGEEAHVTGKVFGVSTRNGTTFMNLGAAFPKHTFAGVVFAGDQEKVGDLQPYDGKTVTLTGRIVLSPQGKPQIVIKSPDQLRLEGAAPVAPAPVPGVGARAATMAPTGSAPAPAAPPSPVAPAAEARKISLAPNWDSPAQSGAMTRKDLALLFSGQGTTSETDERAIVLYGGLAYLTPLAEARKRLRLETVVASKTRVTCPGLPAGSFTAHLYTGVYEGGFNRLLLVTDNADQLVSVLGLDENSRQRTPNENDATGYHTYNFIQHRVKGTGDLVIRHQIASSKGGVVVVETLLVDPHDLATAPPRSSGTRSSTTRPTASRTGKVLERSRWYVPAPVVNLILTCVGSSR